VNLEQRIRSLLEALDAYSDVRAHVIAALADDVTPNRYTVLETEGKSIAHGASTRHLLDYAAFQLGRVPIDREQRDYVILPLREVGVIDLAYVYPKGDRPEPGELVHHGAHLRAKSGNNCYRMAPEVRALLTIEDDAWEGALATWLAGDTDRRRRVLQERSSSAAATGAHADLIRAAVATLSETLLAGYELVYVDDSDGDRIPDAAQRRLGALGLKLDLSTRYPDAILVDEAKRLVWVIDAIVSDGEIDPVRQREMTGWVERAGLAVGGCVNVYRTWRDVARRQTQMKNLALGSLLWVAEDGGRLFEVHDLGS